jgi:hypothetical protein
MSVSTDVRPPVAIPPFALRIADDGPISQSMSLTVVPPRRDLTPAEAKQALTAAARDHQLARADEQAILRGTRVRAGETWLQSVRAKIQDISLNTFPVGAMLTMAGALLTGFTVELLGASSLFWPVFLGGAAAFASIAPASAGVVALARRKLEKTNRAMVELDKLKGPLQRLERSSGVERSLLRADLKELRDKLHGYQLLSPEALDALDAVTGNADELAEEAQRVTRYRALALATQGGIDEAAVALVATTLAACPEGDRPALAQALKDMVFEDRDAVANAGYMQRNRLHGLLKTIAEGGAKPVVETGG